MPYLHDEELGYEVLAKISNVAISRSYSHLVKINEIDIFSRNTSGFIAGLLTKEGLSVVVSITCRNVSYPVEPLGLSNYQQVSMVRTSTEFTDHGGAKLVYDEIARCTDLVSDHEQYQGAKGLWKSLARDSDVNIYIFEGLANSYISENGIPKKYNGINIHDRNIWGTNPEHRTILLVATKKELL